MINNNLIYLYTKKTLKHTIYLFSFLLLFPFSGSYIHAEENRAFNFSTLNLNDGLSQLSVLDICQDSKGYIWFATRNGLNKYDGEHFTIYKHNNHDVNSLSDNHITTLLPDNTHQVIWVGTNNGLNHINQKTNLITRYQLAEYPDLPSNSILSLCQSLTGELWIGTRLGLCYWNPESQTITRITLNDRLKNEPITSLYIDEKGLFYIGTHNKGLLICDSKLNIIQELNKESTPSISDNAISCIYEDSHHHIWIGTDMKGLNKWNPLRRTISVFSQLNSGLTDNYIRCLREQNQQLIIGTFDGLSILNLKNDAITKYNKFEANRNNLSHFSVRSLCVDRAGTLWVGTYSGGVNYYNPLNNRFVFYHPLDNSQQKLYNIFGAMVYTAQSLWIATEGGGLLQFNPVTKEYTNYLLEERPVGMHNKNIIKSLMSEGDNIWCGTNNGGLFRFHIPTKSFSLIHQFNPEKNLGIYTIYRDSKENIWLGTTSRQGLVKISKDGKMTRNFPIGDKNETISFSSIRGFLPLRKNVYLIGTRSFGLYEYDTEKKTVIHYSIEKEDTSKKLGNNYITSILRKKNGEIWIGTFGAGIYQYQEGKGLVRHIGSEEGLTNDEVYALTEYNQNIWASIDNGIVEINTQTGQVHDYDCFAGLETLEFTPQGGICLPNGEVYFSGSNGFLSFTPRSLVKNNMMPPVVLTQLTVNNKAIQPGDNSLLLSTIPDDTETIRLTYYQNNFSIAYCALNYILHEQNEYAYKLTGHDEDWNYVGSRKEAYYTNIAPGKYTFHVIASNNDGAWNKQGKTLEIIILSPWWKTWWAYLIYALLFIGITYIIGYYMYSKHKLELNLRMRQMEKLRMEEFHQTKIRLFTNFSHELRTPLTLIISPLDELVRQAEAPQFIKNKLELVLKNARRLLLLVNQLMDLQKNQSGSLTLSLAHTDLNAFLLEIYYTFKQIAESKQITFQYEAPKGIVPVCFDQSLLEKAVFNLLSNAFKFTSPGETVSLRLIPVGNNEMLQQNFGRVISDDPAFTVSDSGNYYIIQVADTGKGIPEAARTHIFDAFYQVNNVQISNDNVNGTGIGLSLTQSIIHLHHGAISVTPNQPQGSTFTIVLPNNEQAISEEENTRSALSDNENANQPFVVPVEESTKNLPFLEGKTVLLVEDNEDIRNYVKEHLERHYRVLEAGNGATAFDIVLKEFPDLVVTDIMMPGVDGLELCSMIKNDLQTGHIPVILLTARTMVMHVKEGFLSGADDYVVKPFNLDVLLVRIYNLLSQREKLKSVYGKNFSLQSMGIETASADDKFMQKLFEIIKKHLSNPDLKVDLICDEMGFSRSNFYRKIKAVTDLSLNDLIRHKRIEVATQLLKEADMNITEVSMATGFSTLAYFTKCFKSAYGVSPTEYIKGQPDMTEGPEEEMNASPNE